MFVHQLQLPVVTRTAEFVFDNCALDKLFHAVFAEKRQFLVLKALEEILQ